MGVTATDVPLAAITLQSRVRGPRIGGLPVGKKIEFPINGDVLAWAIEEGGYSPASFAEAASTSSLPVDAARVRAWIAEEIRPGKTEFERIATVLKRPTALFLLPRRPQTGIRASLREARGRRGRPLEPDERVQLRWILRVQGLASELHEGSETSLDLPILREADSPESAAAEARRWLGVPVTDQLGWPDARRGFWRWKEALEGEGVFVVQLRMGEEGIRGFSSWNASAPFIAVNSSADPRFVARTFTLFHELAHLLRRDDAACGRFDRRNRETERWCDRFSAAFLLPRDALRQWLEDQGLLRTRDGVATVDQATRMARAFKVSVRAAALRLIDLRYAPSPLYDEVERIARPGRPRSNRPGGQTRVEQRRLELGIPLVRTLFRARETGSMSDLSLSDVLRIPYTELPDLAASVDGSV